VLAVQLLVGAAFLLLVVTDSLPFGGTDKSGSGKPVAAARPNRFDGRAAFQLLKLQLSYGPRPAGSAPLKRLAVKLRSMMPHAYFQPVPHGLRNIVATVPGRDANRYVVVGAHYDSKDIPGFLGANDGAGGTAAAVELARQLKPRTIGATVKFVLFDGEEAPRGVPDSQFAQRALRGSKVAARVFKDAGAMVLLDFISDKNLSIPREGSSNETLWAQLRSAAARAGVARYFPPTSAGALYDDHSPFLDAHVPSIDLIDFDFPCYHKLCDNLSAVSEKSLDASGEAVAALLPTL
jgi:hypothetical protein